MLGSIPNTTVPKTGHRASSKRTFIAFERHLLKSTSKDYTTFQKVPEENYFQSNPIIFLDFSPSLICILKDEIKMYI